MGLRWACGERHPTTSDAVRRPEGSLTRPPERADCPPCTSQRRASPTGCACCAGTPVRHLPADILAGLLVAALAIPQSLGYAVVAGVPVQVGLYTLPPALLAYALFGTSRLLFVGPISTVSVLSGSIVRALSRRRHRARRCS